MYHLEIVGPSGRQILEWDPNKLQARDPNTMKTVAEAARLFKEAVAHRSRAVSGDGAAPQVALSGRWSA